MIDEFIEVFTKEDGKVLMLLNNRFIKTVDISTKGDKYYVNFMTESGQTYTFYAFFEDEDKAVDFVCGTFKFRGIDKDEFD